MDLVDENDRVIDQALRSKIYSLGLKNYRVINTFIINEKGELWIPRRNKQRKYFPGCLDSSFGGHVLAGENYEDTFKRELMEELNIDYREIEWKTWCYLNPYRYQVSSFMTIYRIDSNKTPVYNKTEFIEAFWIEPQRLYQAILSGEPSKSDLKILLELLFDF